MSAQTVTYAEHADPLTVAKAEAARAGFKLRCVRCSRVLTQKELRAGRECADRRACTNRRIQKPPACSSFGVRR